MRRLKNVATEMVLHVLAYNMTRVMKIMGIPAMIDAMKAQETSFTLKSAPKSSNPSQVATASPTSHRVRRNDDLTPK